jgi:hypothetical protein
MIVVGGAGPLAVMFGLFESSVVEATRSTPT